MHLIYCDESNLEKRNGDFLIYGGLMIEGEKAKELSGAVDKIRSIAGVPRNHRLKFNPGPVSFDNKKFITLKQNLIEAAIAHGAKLIVYVILHNIAIDSDTARRNGINAVCFHFDCMLHRHKSHGLVLIDRFNDKGNLIDDHLRDKFSIGLKGMPYSTEMPLSNILGFHYSAIGQSHFPSLIDIILGSLRFSLNAHTQDKKENIESACAILKLIEPLFIRDKDGRHVLEISFQFSPKIIKIDAYREVYVKLKQFLALSGINTEQAITNERMY